MKKLLVNIRYFIAPLLILVTLAGVLAGGAWAWTGVGLLGVGIILDTLINVQTRGAIDENGETLGIPWLQNTVMYMMLPVFVALQVALAYQIYNGMAGSELLGAVLSPPDPVSMFLVGGPMVILLEISLLVDRISK